MKGLAPSLVNLGDPTHRAALADGFSWGTINAAAAQASKPWADRVNDERERLMAAIARDRQRERVRSDMPDVHLRRLAQWRADLMRDALLNMPAAVDAAAGLQWLNARLVELDARPFDFSGELAEGLQLAGFLKRAVCALWWRRQLRRACVQLREREAQARGEVCAQTRQPYVTNDTLARRIERTRANADMMAATVLENEAGQTYTIAELAALSTSNKAVRRGELMTRIRGCEELAGALGHRGVFLTLTAPSRFHAVLREGGRNPRHDGSTPKDAQRWLCDTWARARAKLHRAGVAFYGFRVAEPHHDGCPHWHALLWAAPGQLWRLVRVLRRWWLQDGGDEPGARRHRVKALLMAGGAAAGYVAKYVAKNIDDAGAVGIEGHRDDDAPGEGQGELFGGTAARVEAWASAWGIRQFQAIGQPPVTVWRELRRIKPEAQAGATVRMAGALEAVSRHGQRRADWARYVIAQGGLCKGRDYLLRIERLQVERPGRYGDAEVALPVGVFDVEAPRVVLSSGRREWRPRGEWGARSAPAVPPWTRVINCTHAPTLIDGRAVDFRALMRRCAAIKLEPGAVSPSKGSLCSVPIPRSG